MRWSIHTGGIDISNLANCDLRYFIPADPTYSRFICTSGFSTPSTPFVTVTVGTSYDYTIATNDASGTTSYVSLNLGSVCAVLLVFFLICMLRAIWTTTTQVSLRIFRIRFAINLILMEVRRNHNPASCSDPAWNVSLDIADPPFYALSPTPNPSSVIMFTSIDHFYVTIGINNGCTASVYPV